MDANNTTLQVVLPFLSEGEVMASIGGERISFTPDTPIVAELAPDLDVSLQNGLFDTKSPLRTCARGLSL